MLEVEFRATSETSFLIGVSGRREEDAIAEGDDVDGRGRTGIEDVVVVLDMLDDVRSSDESDWRLEMVKTLMA